MIALLRTKNALSSCETHLDQSSDDTSEIESYLAEYLAVILCADVQSAVAEIVETHALSSCDTRMVGFVRGAFSKLFRSIDKSELSGLVGMFGDEAKSQFDKSLEDRVVSAYSNVVKGRHKVAHSRASVTLKDVKLGLDAAEVILAAMASALRIP